ncbi:Two component histidine kinase [Syntrophobacter sp. SbD1]|nr:Two component histidine kinase [Syntrophobacter sp. SbD1]
MIRLLVVDDKEESLYMLQVLLAGNGYEVATARHGGEALLKAHQAPPDLVISDLLMPVMDGFTLMRLWKADERLNRIPFVVYTATYTDPKDERLALDMGADAFIIKPAEPEVFIARIREVLGQAEADKLKPPSVPADEEKVILKEYAEVLVRKLEKKLLEAEQATLRAQRSEESLLLALDAGEMGTWDWDLTSGEIVWSEGHARLFGLKPEEFDGSYETFRRSIHPDDLAQLEIKVAQAREQRCLFRHEFRVNWPDGSQHWIAGQGRFSYNEADQPVRMSGVVIDITERKAAEEKLRDNVAFLQNLMDAMPHPVFYKDAGGRYLGCNRAFEQFFGIPKKDIVGKTVYDISPKDLAERHASADQELLSNPGTQSYEAAIQSPDGLRYNVIFHKATFFSPDRRLAGIIGSVLDITKLRRAEEERRRAETQLWQAQKMEALGTLAGGIAHDFNNILGIIFGYTEMARLSIPDNLTATKKLDQVLKAADRAKDLVQQILAFSRQGEKEKKPVQVSLVFKEALKMLRATIPSTIDIRSDISSRSTVLGDPTQIHQVLMNLCTNAVHAMRDQGGTLEVKLADVLLEPKAGDRYSELEEGLHVQLIVKDTGHGIGPAIMDRIFDPFFTTKEAGVGTGLGLAVVHGIVNGHGGVIEVESEPGKGTMFKVLIPAAESLCSSDAVKPSLAQGHERILVVDDEAGLASAMADMLEGLGYETLCRTSSLEALETFLHQPGDQPFDLVITDMTMPNLTGLGLARELLRLKPQLPIIICTGFSEHIGPERIEKLGIKGFLMKPVTLRDLAVLVRKVLDETAMGI